jgi:hypothetical protein
MRKELVILVDKADVPPLGEQGGPILTVELDPAADEPVPSGDCFQQQGFAGALAPSMTKYSPSAMSRLISLSSKSPTRTKSPDIFSMAAYPPISSFSAASA